MPKHVRFWEVKFPQVRPMKRGGGRRYYRPEDLELLRGIRHLLHAEAYTIKGVQKILREQGIDAVKDIARAAAAAAEARGAGAASAAGGRSGHGTSIRGPGSAVRRGAGTCCVRCSCCKTGRDRRSRERGKRPRACARGDPGRHAPHRGDGDSRAAGLPRHPARRGAGAGSAACAAHARARS